MKTAADALAAEPQTPAATIVRLADGLQPVADGGADAHALPRARAFAEPLLAGQRLDTGEDALAHADGVAAILQAIGAAPSMRAAAYLVYAGDHLQRPEEMVAVAFGPAYATLVGATRRLVQAQRSARAARVEAERHAQQVERVRKMLLAFASDLRVGCRRCAGMRRAGSPARRRWRASRSMCSRRWPTDSASGRSSGSWRTSRSDSCSRPSTTASPR